MSGFQYVVRYDGRIIAMYKDCDTALAKLWPRNVEMRDKARNELLVDGRTANGPMILSRA